MPPPSTWLAHGQGPAVGRRRGGRGCASPRHRWACSVSSCSHLDGRPPTAAGRRARSGTLAGRRVAEGARPPRRPPRRGRGGRRRRRPSRRAGTSGRRSRRCRRGPGPRRWRSRPAPRGPSGWSRNTASAAACGPGPRASRGSCRISSRITWRSDSMSSARSAGAVSTSPSRSRAELELLGAAGGVVRGVLLGGEGVHLAADRVDRLGELAGRCGPRCP